MKRLLSVLTALIILISSLSFGSLYSYADDTVEYDVNTLFSDGADAELFAKKPPYYLLSGSVTENPEVFTNYKAAAMYIRDCMLKRIGNITVNIKNNANDNLENVYKYTRESSYYPVYGAISYYIANTSDDGDYLASCYAGASAIHSNYGTYSRYTYSIRYRTTFEEEAVVKSFVNSFIKELKAENLTRLEQIKAIHDKICSITEYDTENYNNGNTGAGTSVNTAYSAVALGKTMCEGYSQLFYRICREMGIPVRTVGSETHAWNIVKPFDGKYYYNVDVTWDDCDNYLDNENARYDCRHFLKSDADMQNVPAHRNVLSERSNTDHSRQYYYNSDYFNSHFPIAPTSYFPERGGAAVCPYCNEVVVGGVPFVNEHSYVKTTVPATCIKNCKYVYTCSHCGDRYEESVGASGAHSFSKYKKYCLNGCGKINPNYKVKPVALKSVKPYKTSAAVKWEKGTGTGYQLQYSTSGKFAAKYTKTVNITKLKTVSKTVKKLKRKKKYYFRIRAYDKVNGVKKYSKWSKVKSVKTK
ncbi:MAG: hypothetical protein K6C14_02730 [Eubacterium sp.]|nr:hypothetical protein [Eubacterium sp.]